MQTFRSLMTEIPFRRQAEKQRIDDDHPKIAYDFPPVLNDK